MSHPSEREFDLLVLGGGIHGSAIAWEATLRGYSVALVEKGDFSSGASAGNYRIIHGGLRYLQHFDLARLFESVEEQRIFRVIAPDALKPLPFIIPCYGFGMRGRELLQLGLTFYDLITLWRNRGVRRELHLPFHEVLSTGELLEKAPYLEPQNLRGGIVYRDVQMLDPDRLGIAFIVSAAARGACVLNYTEALSAQLSNDRIVGMRCRDTIRGEEFLLRSKFVMNATGAWREAVTQRLLGRPAPERFVFSKGLQVTLPSLTGEYAIALESKFRDKNAFLAKGNRSYFLQPWRGTTIAGTADILHETAPDEYELREEEVALFLEELSQLYPDPRIQRANVSAIFGGLRPVSPKVLALYRSGALERYGSIEVAHRDFVGAEPEVRNLLNVEGIKYTTTRRLACRVVSEMERMTGEKRGESRSHETPLLYAAAPEAPTEETMREMMQREFVRRPEDLVERRLGFGAFSTPPRDLMERAARLFGEGK